MNRALEGRPSWDKWQIEAEKIILRWGQAYADSIYSKLTTLLDGADAASPADFITKALCARGEQEAAFLALAEKVGQQCPGHGPLQPAKHIGEAQLWALLITRAEPEVTHLDRLGEALSRMQRLLLQGPLDLPRQMLDAERRRQAQRGKGKAGTLLRDANGNSITEMLEDIATDPDDIDLSAIELWPRFLAELDQAHMCPVEKMEYVNSKPMPSCTYWFNGKQRTMKFRSFANAISAARNS